jgi:uncharacterized protein YndB with AHSA1/START domain
MKKIFLSLTLVLFLGISMKAQEKIIEYDFTVDASPSEVYNAWSTTDGIKTFFAPDGKVELKMFGDYQIYFFPENEPGSRGAEGERVISFEENKMISHTWGFPKAFPNLRANQKTIVNVRFIPRENGKTQVHFIQSGWGQSEEWQKSYDYFINAWGNVVLARLQYRFAVGPVDWDNQPDLSKYYLVK